MNLDKEYAYHAMHHYYRVLETTLLAIVPGETPAEKMSYLKSHKTEQRRFDRNDKMITQIFFDGVLQGEIEAGVRKCGDDGIEFYAEWQSMASR